MRRHRVPAFLALALMTGCAAPGSLDEDASDAPDAARDAVVRVDVRASDALDAPDASVEPDVAPADPPDVLVPTDVPALPDTPVDPCTHPASCVAPPFGDPHLASRTSCHFAAGATVESSLGDVTALRHAIQHVVVLMQENRSFDHLFGTLGHGAGFSAGYSNHGADGAVVAPHHLTTACVPDIVHDVAHIRDEWNNGAMDGFARTDGAGSLGYYTPADQPFFSWLATTFAMGDHYFAGMLGPTYPNRLLMYCGTSGGQTTNVELSTTYDNIFRQMEQAGHNWTEFVEPLSPTLVSWQDLALGWRYGHHDVIDYERFAGMAAAGTLKDISFINSRTRSEHPSQSLHDGERLVREVVTAVMSSPLWAHTALIITYDEGGGFFDHVAPPIACVPETGTPNAADFTRLGMRLPLVVVSPWARAGYVSTAVHSPSSVTRFIQAVFGLHAMTRRDANSDALLDLFDFGCAAWATPPTCIPEAAPAGC